MSSPFGVPVTDRTLQALPKYANRTITQEDRAREAMLAIHNGDKNISALEFALQQKAIYGNGVSTLCLVYNATGDSLSLVTRRNWSGDVYRAQPPNTFQNGQWIAFLHVKPAVQAIGTEAAWVYRGKNIKGEVRDYMIAWSVPWTAAQNSAYTEVRGKDHFPRHWDYIRTLLKNADKVTFDESDKHCSSSVAVGGATTSEFIAILKHNFTPEPLPLPDD